MFKVDVISEPAAALSPNGSLWGVEAKRLAQHDLSLVKPALLFADHVELISFRVDMQTIVDSDAIKHFQMPMRLAGSFSALSYRRDEIELERLGLQLGDLCSREQAESFFTAAGDSFEVLKGFTDQHAEKIAKFRSAMRTVLLDRRDGLMSPELDRAIERGILGCSGWSSVQPDPRELVWSDVWEEFIPYTAQCILHRLAESSNVPLLDPGARNTISQSVGSETLIELTGENQGLHLPAGVAGSLMAHLPGLNELGVDELLDLRESLNEYLAAFRGELVSLSDEIESDESADAERLGIEIERRWHRDMAPVVQEIQHEVKSASYPRSLLNSFSADKATMTSAASSVVLAAGSVFAGAGALIPAAAAAAFPFVSALNDSLKSKREIRKNKLYFLYGIQNRLQKRK
ncbi:hypothetical protein AB1339_34205 [Streptomyces cyaneofuscatus]|uniref:hypothetical protein n=1 Tax=Streptomyces cyaneofuscatus TaxID=66883 RepID=UPI00345D6328